MIQLKRVYETPDSADGVRFLVERLWPRGVKKSSLEISAWLKEVAPSVELRKWFHHDPARWKKFRRRYFSELRENRRLHRTRYSMLHAAATSHCSTALMTLSTTMLLR